MYQNLNI